VLVRDRSPEDGHHRVADELLHRPAIALDLRPQALVVRADAVAHVLGVLALRRRREADQVAEEHRDHLPLLTRRGGCWLSQLRTAERTERELPRQLSAATR